VELVEHSKRGEDTTAENIIQQKETDVLKEAVVDMTCILTELY
jgi:hypothetical protein